MKEYTGKINRGYQLTLPPAFRESYHLQIGDYLKMQEENGKLIIEPVKMVSNDPLEALKSLLSSSDDNFNDLPEEQIMDLVRSEIKKSREEHNTSGKNKGKA